MLFMDLVFFERCVNYIDVEELYCGEIAALVYHYNNLKGFLVH